MEKGFPPYPQESGRVTGYIVSKTGFLLNDVRIFLVTILEMSRETKPGVFVLPQRFINPELQKETVIGKVEAAFSKGGLVPKTITTAKWIGILAIAGVGLWLARPLLTRMRR